jgi:hypothetical protein
MISLKRLRIDNNEAVIAFEEWNNEIKPKQRLQKVWVHVYGVLYEIRSFLPLWVVGSIIGAIPNDAKIVVDDCLYEIFLKVDKVVSYNNVDDDPEPHGLHSKEKD